MAGAWWVGEGELNDEQVEVISLEADGSYLVKGPPGSGKTNILLLRANYLTLSGKPNILIVVFTRALRHFIASGGLQYDFQREKIVTCRKMLTDLLFQFGRTASPPSGFEAQRAYLSDAVAELADEEKLDNAYDAIFLDEAQDYTPQEIAVFRKLSPRLFAVADGRQKIYNGDDALGTLEKCVDKTISLKYHYRNGRRICEFADAIAKSTSVYEPMVTTSRYDEDSFPSSVSEPFKGTIAEQCRTMRDVLKKQLRAYPNEHVAVVCPKKDALAEVSEFLNDDAELSGKICLVSNDSAAFDPSKPICISTIHAAKGLEVRALHIIAADGIKKFKRQRNLAYTAVTRAKTSLSIYHDGDLPGYLQSAFATLGPPKDKPSIKSLFGRKA